MLTADSQIAHEHEITSNDMTQQIEHLQRKLDQSQRMATLGELVSTTTHEFNNVLMSIINYTRLAMRQKDNDARQKTLEKLLSASERAARITNSILGAARNRGDQFAEVGLQSLVEDTLVLMERELRKYRIQVEREMATVPPVLGHGSEIQQVLLNLLINARQAMPHGGVVTIRLTHDPEQMVNELTIRDTGSGISPTDLPQIFEPFFSTKSGPDESGKGGTGLGLSSCRDIIERHRGRIRVASTVGKGTAFTLKFPCAP